MRAALEFPVFYAGIRPLDSMGRGKVMAYDVPSRTPWDLGKNAFFVSVRGNSADEIAELWGEAVRRLDRRAAAGPVGLGTPVWDAHGPLRHHLGAGRGGGVQGRVSRRRDTHGFTAGEQEAALTQPSISADQ